MDQRSKIKHFALGLGFGFFSLLSGPPASAEVFRNSYLRFRLPDQWGCQLAGTVWTCRHQIPKNCKGDQVKTKKCQSAIKKHKEAIIHLTAKETGPRDSIKAYLKYLKLPKTIVGKSKQRIQSKVIHLKQPKIKGITWVDGMHLGSELPNYYTRYLATVKENVATLVTFSSHKQNYSKYSSSFFETIKSLKVFSSPKAPQPVGKTKRTKVRAGKIGDFDVDIQAGFEDAENRGQNLSDGSQTGKVPLKKALGLFLGVLAIFLAYFIVKKK